MNFARIIRFSESHVYGSFGVLKLNEIPLCPTLEPPDNFNQVGKSQIPPGQYMCQIVKSPKYGYTWEVMDVPGRSNILFHWGNRVHNTQGCILLARYFGELYGDQAIIDSKSMFQEFMKKTTTSDKLHLTITEHL